MAKISGGEIIVKMLKKEKVEKVFGIIDGTYMGFYSNLGKHGIELLSPRHETCAAHMAGAYARLTGKVGVCMASNGPGVANILPGVAVENGEANRVLLVTSFRRTGITHPDRGGTYQYFNQSAVTAPMTKWSCTVSDVKRIPEIVKRAFRILHEGRPGVVHIDVPENIINGKFDIDFNAPEPHTYRRFHAIVPPSELVAQAADMLTKARHPVIHAGSGITHALAFDQLLQIAEVLQCPVTTSWAGRANINEESLYSIPMIHLDLNNKVRNEADLILTLGSRMGETDWWGKAPYWSLPSKQKMIQVDIDEETLGMNKPAELNIHADVKVFLEHLYVKLLEMKKSANLSTRTLKLKQYEAEKIRLRKKLDESLKDKSTPIISSHIAHICQEVFSDDAIAVFDGGNTAIWANFYHTIKVPNTVLSTPKFGMLGAGVAQALGAKAAFPNRQVYCVIGDGAMGFHPQEVETSIRTKLPVIYIVLADKQWGMVKMNQQFALKPLKTIIKKSLEPHETINTDFNEIQWDKLSESMGGYGERVNSVKDFKPALERAIASKRCAVIHVDVNPVKHMWAPALLAFKEMHQEPKGK